MTRESGVRTGGAAAQLVPTRVGEISDEADVETRVVGALLDGQSSIEELASFLQAPIEHVVRVLVPLVEQGVVFCHGLEQCLPSNDRHTPSLLPTNRAPSPRVSRRPTRPAPSLEAELDLCRGGMARVTIVDADDDSKAAAG